ncbi:MAG: hypothetical protein IKV61_04390 [Clostridia bacterium]|nr:hypothetical protein [Clostridia bacterium]
MKKRGIINLICSLLSLVVLATSVLIILVFNGLLVVESNELIISSSSSIATYDGTALTDKSWRLIKGELKSGHRLSVTVSGSQMGVGISENYVTATVLNKDGVDVSKEYNIVYKPGSLNVKAREITINANSYMKLYDGAPLNSDGYNLSMQSSLVKGHELVAEVSGTITDVGEVASVVQNYRIYDVHGNDVTKNYKVTTKDGKLIVYKQDTLIIETSGNQKYYDGQPLTKDDWYIKNGTLLPEHNIAVDVLGSITEVGSQENDFNVIITDASGADITERYDIVKSAGMLNVLPTPIKVISEDDSKVYDGTPLTNNGFKVENVHKVNLNGFNFTVDVTGSITEVGVTDNTISSCKVFKDGVDVSQFFIVTKKEGILEVIAPEEKPEKEIVNLEFTSESDNKTYDGTPLTNPNWKLTKGELYPNHYALVQVNGTITEPGVENNSFTVQILDENEQDASMYYNVKTVYGKLEVKKAEVTITSGSAQKVYDGFSLTKDSFEVKPSNYQEEFNFNATIIGSRVDVGVSKNTIATIIIENLLGEDVTNCFEITREEGVLEVVEVPEDLKPELVFVSGSSSKVYDGEALTNSVCVLKSGVYYPNHRSVIEMLSSITEVGKIDNEITVYIYDENEVLVNDKYKITFETGTLEVTPKSITVTAGSDEKYYDGLSLTCNEFTFAPSTALISGHTIVPTIFGEIVDVGQIPNQITAIKIVDGEGNDFTNCYDITLENGTLTILDRDNSMLPSGLVPKDGDGEEPADTVLYKVWSTNSEIAYLRMQSFGNYNGEGFEDEPIYQGSLDVNPLRFPYLALSSKNTTSDFIISKVHNQASDVLPYFYSEDSAFNSSGVAYFEYISNSGLNYYEYTLPAEYQSAEEEYRNFVKRNFLALPETTKTAMGEVIANNSLDKSSPNIINEVATLVKNTVKYSKTFHYEGDVAVYFFNGAKTGICSHYATAATALFRALDIPARYVGGIAGYVEAYQESELKLPLHAWVEVYIDGFGWVPVEVTGSDENGGIGGINNGPIEEGEQEKPIITIKPVDVSKVYDGTPLVHNQILEINGLDLENYWYNVTVEGEQTDSGTSPATILKFVLYNEFDVDVTHNYEVNVETGNITVEKREVTLVAGSASKEYDRTELINTQVFVSQASKYTLVAGHSIVATVEGSQTVIGSSSNEIISIDIIDELKNSVLHNYDYTLEKGELTVRKINLTVKANDASKYYDGTSLTVDTFTYEGNLLVGHTINCVIEGSQTAIGSSNSIITERVVLDKNNEDVTDVYYELFTYDGILEVLERSIIVTANSKEKVYDGGKLICNSYNVENKHLLLEGHTLKVIISGEQTEVGTSPNLITKCVVLNKDGVEVVGIYNISTFDGTLTVTAPLEIFEVKSSSNTDLYLRQQSYGDYNGQYFNEAVEYIENYESISPYYFISYGLKNGGKKPITTQITPKNGIYALPYYSTGEDIYGLYDVFARGDTSSTYSVNHYVWGGTEGVQLIKAHVNAEKEYRDFVYANYLKIDDETEKFLKTFITKNKLNEATNSTIINDVANVIKKAAYYDVNFDENLENEENLVTAFLSDDYDKGVCRHFAAAATMLYRALGIPARYTVGFKKAVTKTIVTSADAHAWVEVYVDGIGWIYKDVTGSVHPENKTHSLIVKPVDIEQKFVEGKIAEASSVSVSSFRELQDVKYSYTSKVEGVSTTLGKVSSYVTEFTIYNASNEVVYQYKNGETIVSSKNINVKYEEGVIHQYLDVLEFKSGSAHKVYDGTALTITEDEIEHISGKLDEGYSYEISDIKELTNAGQVSSSFNVTIYKDGVNCTDHYKIKMNTGTLTVNVKEITLTAGSSEKPHDGTPLINNNILYKPSDLADGDYIDAYIIKGIQTNIGISSNVIDVTSIVIKNTKGQVVTSNYKIKTIDGELKVTVR